MGAPSAFALQTANGRRESAGHVAGPDAGKRVIEGHLVMPTDRRPYGHRSPALVAALLRGRAIRSSPTGGGRPRGLPRCRDSPPRPARSTRAPDPTCRHLPSDRQAGSNSEPWLLRKRPVSTVGADGALRPGETEGWRGDVRGPPGSGGGRSGPAGRRPEPQRSDAHRPFHRTGHAWPRRSSPLRMQPCAPATGPGCRAPHPTRRGTRPSKNAFCRRG